MVNQVLVVYLTLLLGIPTGADWTMYFAIMDAEYKGDREMIAHVFDKFPRFMCEDPVRMQVKMNDGETTHLTSELFSIDSVEKGFPCLNVNHSDSVCDNYQVRYCCPGGHGAKWCLTSEELDHHPVKENYSIEIRENTKVDETVWKIPYGDVQGNDNTLNDVVATSVEIMSGNEKNRFSVSENNTSVILAGLLDADILSWYSLVIYLTFTNGSLWPVYLNINITDVYDWPLVYNSTCETRARIKNDDSLLQPFQIRIHGVSTEKIIRHYEDTTLVLNNTECNILLFGKTSRILNGYDAKKLQLKYHFEDGSNTFQADFAFLKDDDPAIKGYSSERDKKTFYLYYVVLRGINSHGPTKLTFEICMKDTGKLLYGWNRPIEYNVLGCPQSRYGARCQYECNCKNGASCHMWNGACKCQSGWWGPACDIPMKAIATLDTVVTVEEPTPLYSQMHFICSVTYMNVKSVIWKLNETVIREQPSRIETGTIDPDSIYILRLYNLTREDSGVYKCILHGNGDTAESNDFKLRVEGCKTNAWGENCDRLCDCINAVSCLQNEGCICEVGWDGRLCHLDIQPPQIHHCPNDITVPTYSDGTAFVTWDTPNVTDNAGPPSISSNYKSGEEFNIGSKTVIFNVSDGFNNVYCSFTVKVSDSRKHWLTALLSIIPAVIVITVLVGGYIFYGKNTGRNPIYVPLDDVLSLPEVIPNIDLKNLVVLQHIGQGEFSHVKSGKLYNGNGNAQDVAIKILKEKNMEAQYTFREECERLNDLKGHQNIIQLIGVVTESGKKYIVTELMDSDLLNVLTALNMTGVVNLITDRRFVKFSLGIARALEHMEKMKIVHRDIAARNILISHEDIAKVGDFGFARDVYQMGEYHRYQRRPGRFPTRWMAPESLQDKIYTSKSDIWSYGILMWEIANLGASPNYPDVDDVNAKTLSDHLLQGCRLPRSRNCSVEIFRLMNRCWYNQARDRCSAGVIAEELSQYVDADRGFFFQEAG